MFQGDVIWISKPIDRKIILIINYLPEGRGRCASQNARFPSPRELPCLYKSRQA